MAIDFFYDVGRRIYDTASDLIFGEGPRTSGDFNPQYRYPGGNGGTVGENTAIDINIGFPTETKGSGVNEMPNDQIYTGAMGGSLVGIGSQIVRNLPRVLGGGGVGGAVGGALTGYGVGQMMSGMGNVCEPKPFVRFDKCGRPIITRKMQQQAEALVNMAGPEYAAQVLGIDLPLLLMIASKKFKARAKGITGAQLRTATRVNNKIFHMHDKLVAACKAPRRPAAKRKM